MTNRTTTNGNWLTRNINPIINIMTIAFLAGNVFVYFTLGDRIDDVHTATNIVEEALVAHEAIAQRRHCLLAYAIDFPDPQCDWFREWLDDHPEVRNRVRGQFNNGTNGRDSL